MYSYKLILEYDGTGYSGWQIQPQENLKTIQGELNFALKKITAQGEVKSIASGRTDAGVHAENQVVKISIEKDIEALDLLKSLNAILSENIFVKSCERLDADFHPVFDAHSKEYHYRFTFGRKRYPLMDRFIANCSSELDIELMKQAVKLLKGKHDFINYFCQGTPVQTTIREIYAAELYFSQSECGMEFIPDHYVLKICGQGFLKQMVRLLVGAIWNVGKKKLSLQDFEYSLKFPLNHRVAEVAPAKGLMLHSVSYPTK